MAGFRPTGMKSGVIDDQIYPGDTMLLGESVLPGAISTVGAGVWTAAAIASGIINRTGPTGAYTDTTDSATNILTALSGNAWAADTVPGSSFRLLVINQVAFALTFAAGTGVTTGIGVLNVAASTAREYLVTVLNATPQISIQCNTTNGSAAVTFVLPGNQVSYNQSPASAYNNITPGATVTGAGIPAGATIIGMTAGQGGITGFTLSANATATSAAGGTPLTIGPTIKIDGLCSFSL